MADRWTPDTDHFPHRCRRTGQSGVANGPYFHDEIPFRAGFSEPMFDRANPDREHVLYTSAQWVKDMLRAPGSPFACVTTEEYQAILNKVEKLTTELAEARALIDELEASFKDRLHDAVKDSLDAVDKAVDRITDRLAGATSTAPSEATPARSTRKATK